MRLNDREFKMMNSGAKRIFQKHFELRTFKKLGFNANNKDILEIGCGSGYGAYLINTEFNPKSYTGIDLMPEQINRAMNYSLKDTKFLEMDATDLSYFKNESLDLVVIFGILHHIPDWQKVINEIHRILKPEGEFFIQEPFRSFVKMFDNILKWHHDNDALFLKSEFEDHINNTGFQISKKSNFLNLMELLHCVKN